eukprot:1203149-Rhodomonas_salina.1
MPFRAGRRAVQEHSARQAAQQRSAPDAEKCSPSSKCSFHSLSCSPGWGLGCMAPGSRRLGCTAQ